MGIFDDFLEAHSDVAGRTKWWQAPGSNLIDALRSAGRTIGIARDLEPYSQGPTPPRRRPAPPKPRQSFRFDLDPGGPTGGGLPGQGGSRIDDILRELEELRDPGRYMMDPGQLQQQARSSVEAQYGPLIAALRQQQSAAQRRGQTGKREIGQMFGGLSRNLKAEIPDIQDMYEGFEEETGERYEDLDREIAEQYAETQAEQEAMLKRLGIEAAAPDMFKGQMEDEAFFRNLGRKEEATEESALGEQERGMLDYTRSGSQIAQLEGTQRQADLMSQLRELMTQYDTQIGAHETAKEQAYQSALGQLQQQTQEQAMQRAQQDFQNYIAQINLGRGLRSDEREMIPEGPDPTTSVESPGDIIPYLSDRFGMDYGAAQRILEVYNDAVSRPGYSRDPVHSQTRTPQERRQFLLQLGDQMGLSNAEKNALIDIAYQIG